jgi:hypothetical protein
VSDRDKISPISQGRPQGLTISQGRPQGLTEPEQSALHEKVNKDTRAPLSKEIRLSFLFKYDILFSA